VPQAAAAPAQEPIDDDRPLLDRPAQAAEFRALLVGGRPQAAVPADALPKAAQKVDQLRQAVAARFAVAPQALMLGAASGAPATVGGIPVGPLPGTEVPLDGGQQVVPLAAPLATAVAINPAGWHWIGPGNIGGRIRAVLIHPTQPQTMWIGGVAGGVWRTTNGGVSWAPLYDFMASVAVSCMALDPNNPNTLFVGTGEGFFNADAVRGFGIFVSKNGGATWAQLPSTANDNFRYVNRLAVVSTEATATVMLAATRAGLFRSTNGGATFQAVAAPMNSEVLDVRFHPTDPKLCVAGARNGKAFYSANGGVNWTAATGIAEVGGFGGRVELAYARANGSVVYASVDDGTGKLYRSTDGGKTYTLRGTPGHLAGQGWYANCLWAGDPTNPNLLVVGGLDLYRSTTGGTTFTKISVWQSAPASAHADHHVIVAHPKYNGTTVRTVLFGNDGGLFRADNVTTVQGTTGWQELNNGLGVTQYYAAAAHPPTGKVVGGTQDNGTLFFTPPGSPDSWKTIFGGDGGDSAADPVQEFYYGEYIRLQIHRSQNGNPSSYIFTGITDAGTNALFIAPFVLDPNNASRMLAGGASLWRSNDVKVAAPTWKAIKPPGAGLISAIAVAPGDSKVVWVGTQTGSVERSANATAVTPTWAPVGAGLPVRYCSRIAFDPHDAAKKTVYVTSTGYTAQNLHKTTDDGATWSPLGAGVLPEIPFYDLVVHPADKKLLYLGTELGVFVSDDAGSTWSPTNQGPTNAPVYRLFWVGSRLYAATHGRGIFHIDLTTPSSQVAAAVPAAAPVIDP
jgi:photosystem II stability/assembly factor-like uncharacterized protein